MFKMMRTLTLAALLVGLALSHTVLAADVPTGATKNDELSAIALTKAKEVFAAQKEKLLQQLDADTALPDDQKQFIKMVLGKAEQQLAMLTSIDVYFVDESAPGAAYDEVFEFYEGKLNHFETIANDDLAALAGYPLDVMTPETQASLQQLLDAGDARAAGGTSGSSRVSVMTFYIHPETLEFIHKTTISVATTK